MDLHACFRVMVMCMLTLSPGFGLNLTCESKWEEYSEVKCTCMDTYRYYKWYLYSGTQEILASVECKMNETCSKKTPQISVTRFGTEGGILTIPSVTVDMATVECIGARGNSKTFKLPVFARPLQPVCPEPIASDGHLLVVCRTNSVFPEGVCKFKLQGDLANMRDMLKLIEYSFNLNNDLKYITACIFIIPLELVRDGLSNGFQVGVTPNVSAAESATVYTAARVSKFTINSDSKSVSVRLGQSIKFKCLTEGRPMTNVSITKSVLSFWPDKTLFQNATYELKGAIEAATCDDGGIYACNAFNGFSDRTEILVQVRDYLRLDPNSVLKYQVYTSDRYSAFQFKVYGCPNPTKFSLTRVVGDSSNATRVGESHYLADFRRPRLTLTFPARVLEVGENRLTLTVKNDLDEIRISFDVQLIRVARSTTTMSFLDKDDDDDDDNDSQSDSGQKVSVTASAIGAAFGCLVVLGVCIVAILCYRHKRKQTRRPPPMYFHSVNEQTQGTDARYISPEPATNVPNTTEEQRWRSSTLPDVIFTTRASSAPPVEIMTTSDDIRAYHNFRPPPSYETVVHNDGHEGLATSRQEASGDSMTSCQETNGYSLTSRQETNGDSLTSRQETNGDSLTSVPEAPPPSYASVQAASDPPPSYTDYEAHKRLA